MIQARFDSLNVFVVPSLFFPSAVLGYTVPCAMANVFLTLLGPVIVLTV